MIEKSLLIKLTIGLVVILGGYFRQTGLNWDQNHHLQPDERYISMVLSSLSPPTSLTEYLGPDRSSVSPYIHNFGAYIYGQLPLTVLTYLSRWLGMVGYDKTFLLGRGLSALLDTLSILLTFKLGKRLWNEKVGIIGAAFYAFSPLAIQYSHFMVMESWVVFLWLTVMLALSRIILSKRISSNKRIFYLYLVLIGILLGAAMAVKVSSVVLLPLVVGWIAIGKLAEFGKFGKLVKLVELGLIGIAAVLSFRFFQPTIFQSASWLDWSLRQDFYQALNFQKLAIDGKVMFPPQWQWVNTPRWWFPLKNIVLWGLGPVVGTLAVIGVINQIRLASLIRRSGLASLIRRSGQIRPIGQISLIKFLLAVWIIGVFLWQGSKFAKTMRYFLPLFPLLTLFAASVVPTRKTVLVGSVMFAGIWALMFTSVYRKPTTRVAASEWIYKNIPAGSKVMLEEWDDPLPLSLINHPTSPNRGEPAKSYQAEMVQVYAPDDEKKQAMINGWLHKFDWIILSSNRAKGGIGNLPEEFPLMSMFYEGLDQGNLGFIKVAEFTSFPQLSTSLAGWRVNNYQLAIDDSSAEESFWVYDHPTVTIYKKQ